MIDYEPRNQPWDRYRLSRDAVREKVDQLLETRPPTGHERLVCYMLNDSDPEDRIFTDAARTVECTVFDERFGNDAQKMHEMYGEYDDAGQSSFFLSIDREAQEIAGVLRIIRNGPKGLKTLNDMASADFLNDPNYINRVQEHYGIADMNGCWDIATAAVPGKYRGASPLIYRALLVALQKADIKHIFSVIDEAAFAPMQALGFPFEPLLDAGWVTYEDSANSLPVYGYVPDFEPAIQRREAEMVREGQARLVARMAFGQIGRGTNDDALQF